MPGVVDADTIRQLATTIPGPLNVVAGLANTIDAPTLFSLGVKRVSLGGSLARAALSPLERAGRELDNSGTLGFLDGVSATPTYKNASARNQVTVDRPGPCALIRRVRVVARPERVREVFGSVELATGSVTPAHALVAAPSWR